MSGTNLISKGVNGGEHFIVSGQVKMHPTLVTLQLHHYPTLCRLVCHLGLFKYSRLLAVAVTLVMLQQRVIDLLFVFSACCAARLFCVLTLSMFLFFVFFLLLPIFLFH